MKGEILPDHIPLNKFNLKVAGFADIVAVTISGLEDELEKVTLPDRTVASNGERGPTEFELAIPMHHTVTRAALEAWFREGQDPVLPTYKKPATLAMTRISGKDPASYSLVGLFIFKRVLPDLDKADEGGMALATYMFSADDILPL